MDIESQPPIVVIGFSGAQSPFEEFWPATHRALLPVGGKAAVVHLIESLSVAGFRHVRVASDVQQKAVRRCLGDGRQWDVRIRYSDLHAADLTDECVVANSSCLYVNGDIVHAYPISPLHPHGSTSAADIEPGGPAQLFTLGADAGLRRWRVGACDPRSIFRMDSARNYHQANIAMASGQLCLSLPGTQIHSYSANRDWRSRVESNAYIGRNVIIGRHAYVGRGARLEGDCVLSSGVIVGAGCRLKNVTVLPNVRIRAGTKLADAVIAPDGICDLVNDAYDLSGPCERRSFVSRSRANREDLTGLPDPIDRPVQGHGVARFFRRALNLG